METAFGETLGEGHSPGGDRAQEDRQPGLGGQRRGSVLVHVPDRGRAVAPRRQDEQQLGVVDEEQVRARGVLAKSRPGGAEGAEPAPAGGARNGDGGESTTGPFGKICVRRDVGDVVPGVEERPDLAEVDPGVGGMVHDRAHHEPHYSGNTESPESLPRVSKSRCTRAAMSARS